jgi:prophage DNA circulation protein
VNEDYRHNQLWNAAYDLYYYVYFDELLSDALAGRWSRIDDFVKGVLAVTSAAASWALWQKTTFKPVWGIVAAVGALIAILHLTFGVAFRVRDFLKSTSRLVRLRMDIQTFRTRMALNPGFALDEFEAQFLDLKERYSDECLLTTDFLATRRLRESLQEFLNSQIT